MRKYTLLVAFDVFEFIERLSRKEQLALRKRFLQIGEYPHNYSDYSEADDLGRLLEMNICGKFAIKFWIDAADRHLKILDVHYADRRK